MDGVSAREMMASAYLSISVDPFDLSVLAGDFMPSAYLNRDPVRNQLYHWDTKELIPLAQTTWEDSYKAIACLNAILERSLSSPPDYQYIQVMAEVNQLKGWIYFNLLQLFSTPYSDRQHPLGIILRNSTAEADAPRSTKEVCLEEIHRLFTVAETLYNSLPERYSYTNTYLTPTLLYAMWAEVYLYRRDYRKVIQMAENAQRLTPTKSLRLADIPRQSWQTGEGALWIYPITAQSFYRGVNASERTLPRLLQFTFLMAPNRCPSPSSPRHEKYTMQLEGFKQPVIGKYARILTNPEQSVQAASVYRPPQILYTKAEALIMTNRADEAARIIDGYTGYPTGIGSNKSTAENLKLLQKDKLEEFVGEGKNYLDLKRWGLPCILYNSNGTEEKTIQPNDYRFTWPIPPSERYNTYAPEQNPGWTTYVIL